MSKIFRGVTSDTIELTQKQENFLDKLYEEGLKEVFGEDGHGAFKETNEADLLKAGTKFIETFVKENNEQYNFIVATSPYNSRMRAKELAGGDLEKVTVLSYPWVSDWRFVKFYLVLEEFDNLSDEERDLLQQNKEYAEILRSGIYDIVVAHSDNNNQLTAFISPTFSWVETDEDGRLHSLTEPAVAWRDGYKEYAILGIFFSEDVWRKIVNKELSTKEIMEWKNDDEKAAILSVYGTEWLIESYGAQKIETVALSQENAEDGKFYLPVGTGEYHLYLVDKIFPQPEYFVGYVCPSTGRKYFECVPQEEGQKGVLASMAWKFHTDKDSFKNMKYHA
ncbi:MAG: hypothetical protein NUV65_06465 [Candidatus Roizmanbacteria bacterium]|nr:hypothetical protein [Candidatus Roizmanbacteria bacterium]